MNESTEFPVPKNNIKRNAWILLAALVIGVFGYGYYWYQGTVALQQQAQAAIEENITLQASAAFVSSAHAEYLRCQAFISQSQGDFGSFQYCTKFIQWANAQNLTGFVQ